LGEDGAVGDLFRSMVVCGLLSGTQPITIMALLLVMSGEHPRRTGWSFLAGAFLIESLIVLTASLVVGGSLPAVSIGGKVLLIVRLVLGLVLLLIGLRLRRPPRKPAPEVPKALERLQHISPFKAMVAGVVLADYQGPAIASLALAGADASSAVRLVSLLVYTLFATGIPLAIMLITARSRRANERVVGATNWVMHNRRILSSWFAVVLGLLLIADAAITLLTVVA
jgi:hypothetical protein